MTSNDSKKIKNTLKSIPYLIGYFIVISHINWIIQFGSFFTIFFGVIPILLFLGGIWEIQVALNLLKIIEPYLRKIEPYLRKIGSNFKKIRTYFKNSYNNKGQPKVVFWFQIYCLVLILISFLLTLRLFLGDFAGDYPVLTFSTVFGLVVCIPPLFLPRKHWVWIYNLTLLGISVTSIILIPVCVPLIVLYSKPEVRKYYKS